ncbi:MAG: DUF3685 domain-containing protein, partial [Cyanobacteria bacterium J06641_5]
MSNSANRPIRIFCIDDDIVFRLGLGAAIAPFEDLQIVEQVTIANATAQLAQALNDSNRLPNLVLFAPGTMGGWEMCRALKEAYPALPILLLLGGEPPSWVETVRELGIEGIGIKGMPLVDLVTALRQVAAGDRYWPQRALPAAPLVRGNWLQRQQQEALATIAVNLRSLERAPAEVARMSQWAWLLWSGRQRELRAARWLVQRLLPAETTITPAETRPVSARPRRSELPLSSQTTAGPLAADPSALEARPHSLAPATVATVLAQFQGGAVNGTKLPLAFDILQVQPRQELLYAAIAEFETLLEELRFLQMPLEEFADARPQLLRQLWQQTLLRFFGQYHAPDSPADLLDNVVAEATATQTALLARIPLVAELLAYCLYEEPLTIENVPYRAESPEARTRATELLENLIVAIADATMQALLNAFSDTASFRSGRLLQQQYLSTRELDGFRNSLSFRYIQNDLFAEPKAIYEDRYRLIVCREGRLKSLSIYAPRRQERSQLTGVRAGVRLALE